MRWQMGAALWADAAATASSSPVRPAAPSVCPKHALLDSSTAGWGPAAPGRGVPASVCRSAPTSIGSPSGVPACQPQSALLWYFHQVQPCLRPSQKLLLHVGEALYIGRLT